MDFSQVDGSVYGTLGVLLLAGIVGKSLGMESRVLLSLVVVAAVSPSTFVYSGLATIILCVLVKGVTKWVSWL